MEREELKKLVDGITADEVMLRMCQQQPGWMLLWADQQDLRDYAQCLQDKPEFAEALLLDRLEHKVKLVMRSFVVELLRQAPG